MIMRDFRCTNLSCQLCRMQRLRVFSSHIFRYYALEEKVCCLRIKRKLCGYFYKILLQHITTLPLDNEVRCNASVTSQTNSTKSATISNIWSCCYIAENVIILITNIRSSSARVKFSVIELTISKTKDTLYKRFETVSTWHCYKLRNIKTLSIYVCSSTIHRAA